MQKKNYQQFQDERETEMHNYPTGIPVGQPVAVNPYPHPQQYPAEQYHPQQYYAQPPMQPHPQQQIQFIPQGVLPPPPPMPQQVYLFLEIELKITAFLFKFNVHAVKWLFPQLSIIRVEIPHICGVLFSSVVFLHSAHVFLSLWTHALTKIITAPIAGIISLENTKNALISSIAEDRCDIYNLYQLF